MSDKSQPITFSMLVKQCQQITVPRIQRDYAQGRESEQEVRETFLKALHAALVLPKGDPKLPLNLDFIYGNVEEKPDRSFFPLDGQQRLTTLFLLHWYLAWRDDQLLAFKGLMWDGKHSRFSYGVRPSSAEFFDELVQYIPTSKPDADTSVRKLIENQSWFFLYWRLDPTIQSALHMLDAMHRRLNSATGLYARLVDDQQPAITFQLLPLEHFGLSDDLYIKMNARGKPLTRLETFKARFEEELKTLFPTEFRKLGDGEVSVPEFFARRMDTQWTDFFWNYKNPVSNTFDDAVMNLFWALARVSLAPESATFATDMVRLRGNSVAATYTTFHERGWLNRTFAENVIYLLEAWSAGGGKLRQQLPNGRYFDETAFFQKASREPAALTYTELVQFAAFLSYLKQNEGVVEAGEFQEWARVIYNLSINSTIDGVEEFGRALTSVQQLVPHSRQVLSHLAAREIHPRGFNIQQGREEILKAQLILGHSGWRGRIEAAERHGYFRGQIEFLFDFSTVIAEADSQPINEWPPDDHPEFQASFDDYWKKAQATFDASGLVIVSGHPHLWQRALLAVGDYLMVDGSNHSFLTNAPTNSDSWKNFLRDDDGISPPRWRLKSLWDRLDATTDIVAQLVAMTASVGNLVPWRKIMIQRPEAISYCENHKIRRKENEIYLLKKLKMSGAHAELFSYALYLDLQNPAASAKLSPLKIDGYDFVKGTENEPHILLSYDLPKCRIRFVLFSHGGQFQIRSYDATGEDLPQIANLLRTQAGLSGSDQRMERTVHRQDIHTVLQAIATLLAGFTGSASE